MSNIDNVDSVDSDWSCQIETLVAMFRLPQPKSIESMALPFHAKNTIAGRIAQA